MHCISFVNNIKFNRINFVALDTKIELNLPIIQLFIDYGVQLRTLPLLEELISSRVKAELWSNVSKRLGSSRSIEIDVSQPHLPDLQFHRRNISTQPYEIFNT